MINNVVLMGRLTKDPELRTTANGVSVTENSLAVERDYKPQGEERATDFLTIVAWRGTADFICRYFHKGDMIAIQGSIQTRKYEDKNGNARTAVEIIAEKASFCGGKSNGNNSAGNAENTHISANFDNDEDGSEFDDFLPF